MFINIISCSSYQQNSTVDIKISTNLSSCNLTVQDPTTNNLISNVIMQENVGFFNYTINSSSTTQVGEYKYYSDCGSGNFEITPSGKEISMGEAILYSFFILVFLGILVLLTYFIIVLPGDNIKGPQGEIGIIKLKYVRIILIAFTYALMIVLLNLITGVATNFLTLSFVANIFGFLFEMLLRLAWPFIVILFVWIGYLLIKDSNIKKQIKKFERIKF